MHPEEVWKALCAEASNHPFPAILEVGDLVIVLLTSVEHREEVVLQEIGR